MRSRHGTARSVQGGQSVNHEWNAPASSGVRVLVLKGGPDAEREVSLLSGTMVAAALRRGGFQVHEATIDRPGSEELRALPGDVVFPALHGAWGEGGPLQEILEEHGRPYVGARPRAARLAMDKPATKALVAAIGIPTPRSQELVPGTPCSVACPLVIKPADDGSSVDLRICRTPHEVATARAELESRRARLLAEEYVAGRELTVGIIDGECLPIIEIRPRGGTYDYEAKYTRDDTEYLLDPELPPGIADAVRAFSRAAWHAVGCRDVARADFMLDGRGPWFLEINTMPGFTDHSLVPKAAQHAGMDMEALTGRLVHRALQRRAQGRVAA